MLFTGLRDDVPAVTAALDVAVLPSYREAQGLAILEAMALRRPVVATAVGGVPEMIEHGRTGLLVPPRDAAALAAAIVRMLTDHPLADTLARAGHDFVHEQLLASSGWPAPWRGSTKRARPSAATRSGAASDRRLSYAGGSGLDRRPVALGVAANAAGQRDAGVVAGRSSSRP